MADIININDTATEVVAALNDYGDFSVGMTATEFVGEVNTAFPDADASVDDTASELVDKVNNADTSPIEEGTMLKFLHYSDPHTLANATNKTTKMMSDQTDAEYDADIEFAILTGDNQIWASTSLANAIASANNNGKHLLIMGNHDAGDHYGRDAEGHTSMVSDLKGYMSNGGVTYGGNNVAYWYKDFDVHGLTGKVRLIGTDEYEAGGSGYEAAVSNEQASWLIDRLDELGKDDFIIIATHQVPFYGNAANAKATRRRNKFCCTNMSAWDSYNTVMDVFSDIVKAYKNGETLNKSYPNNLTVYKDWSAKKNQATFLCFLCGHVHADYHSWVNKTGYEDLLVMCVDTSKQGGGADFSSSVRAAASYININKVTVDFYAKRIRIDRIGCQQVDAMTVDGVDYPACVRNNITFDYDAQVIQEGGTS